MIELTNIPFGYCQCGCGNKTTKYPRANITLGRLKNQQCKYLRGHFHRMSFAKMLVNFWRFVRKTEGCWFWTAAIMNTGYGEIGAEGNRYLAHRISWEIAYGKPEKNLYVLHKCDNRACVRPDHLFLGTHQDNMDDMIAKKRHSHGEKHIFSKLTEQAVREIRSSPLTISKLSQKFNVSYATVRDARLKITWKHL